MIQCLSLPRTEDSTRRVLGFLNCASGIALRVFQHPATTPQFTLLGQIWQQAFLETSLLSLAVIYALNVSRPFWRNNTAQASVRAMNCSCASTAFVGIPLLVIALGKDGALPAILATTVIVTVFLGLTFALIESGRHGIAASGRALAATPVASFAIR